MKSTEADMMFPVLGFAPDGDILGFPDLDTLTSCGPRTLRENLQIGVELVDAAGRRWVVRSVVRLGRGEPLLKWIVSALLWACQSRIEQELEPLAPLSLDEIKERTCAAVERDAWVYADDHPRKLKVLLAKIRAAKSAAAIHGMLGLDNFTS
jgi:hypothetical protein